MIALVLACLSGIFYRLGGYGLPFNTKVRDFGVPSCMITYFMLTEHWNWILILCFGLMFGAQTTYFKKKGSDAKWYNWLLVSLAFSFAMLPYTWITGHWVGFELRTLVVIVITVIWSELIGNVNFEEFFRGFIQIITLPLLML